MTIQNQGGTNTGFLAGALDFSNGFSTTAILDAHGEGTTVFPQQTGVTWVQLTATLTDTNGPSLSEFIVGGSYRPPVSQRPEGDGRNGNNLAAAAFVGNPCDAAANHPPVITSAPPLDAQAGRPYTYTVQAADPDGDSLIFSLPAAPAGMTVAGSSGLVAWTPTQAGDYTATLHVADGRGGMADQSYNLAVAAANRPPQFLSTAPVTATVGQIYTYVVRANDPDGDLLSYTLALEPAGATFDPATTTLSWTPSPDQGGRQSFFLRAEDDQGGQASQPFVVAVAASATLPILPVDADGDGFVASEECQDDNPNVNPGQTEIPGNGLDDDCNPATPDTLPAAALNCSIVTLKRTYPAHSLAQMTLSIRNLSEGPGRDGACRPHQRERSRRTNRLY